MHYKDARVRLCLLLISSCIAGFFLYLTGNFPLDSDPKGLILDDPSNCHFLPCLLSIAITVVIVFRLAHNYIVAEPKYKQKVASLGNEEE